MSFLNRQMFIQCQCANCAFIFSTDDEKNTSFTIIDEDSNSWSIKHMEALSLMVGSSSDKLTLKFLENIFVDGGCSSEELLNFDLCHNCAGIFSEMYSTHQQFAEVAAANSYISKVLGASLPVTFGSITPDLDKGANISIGKNDEKVKLGKCIHSDPVSTSDIWSSCSCIERLENTPTQPFLIEPLKMDSPSTSATQHSLLNRLRIYAATQNFEGEDKSAKCKPKGKPRRKVLQAKTNTESVLGCEKIMATTGTNTFFLRDKSDLTENQTFNSPIRKRSFPKVRENNGTKEDCETEVGIVESGKKIESEASPKSAKRRKGAERACLERELIRSYEFIPFENLGFHFINIEGTNLLCDKFENMYYDSGMMFSGETRWSCTKYHKCPGSVYTIGNTYTVGDPHQCNT